jgi:hypothetical protein
MKGDPFNLLPREIMHLYRNLPMRGCCLLIACLFMLAACRPDKATNIPDVSDIRVNLDITRFEQLLLQDTTLDAVDIQALMVQHPAFGNIFFDHVMPGSDDLLVQGDPELKVQHIREWVKHPRTRWLYDTVQHIFPDIKNLEKELTEAFTYAKYYFAEKETPRIYTTISDFGYFPFIYAEDSLRDGIGISLEMFLGAQFPYRAYNGINNAFSDYLIRSYNKDHIVRRVLEVWVDDFIGPSPGNRMLDMMIHNGKKLYILQCLMPAVPDTVVMDYSQAKMDWAKANERNIWVHFTTQNLLYETSLSKIQKLIGPSPSSPGLSPESPGNLGSWMGWQIVKAYMAKHPATTLHELIAIPDAQVLLNESAYKPPR